MNDQLYLIISNAYFWAGLAGAYLFISSVRSWARLRHIDGPRFAGWSYLFMFRMARKAKQGEIYGDLVDKYGKLVRIGPNDLVTGDADLVRKMNSARSRYSKSNYYKAINLSISNEDLFSTVDTVKHDKLKAKMAHGYSGKEVPTMEADVDEQIGVLVNTLRTRYVNGDNPRPFDLAMMSEYFTLDALSRIAFGESFGHMEVERDVYGFISAGVETLTKLVLCAEVPMLRRIFMNKPMLALFGPKPTDKQGMGRMLGLAESLVAKRFESGAEDQLDMLGSFVRHGLSQRQCASEIPFQVIAGADTTSHTIRSTLLYLMSSPLAYQKIRAEIDDGIAKGNISTPIKLEEAKRLPYLQGVIYEGLRVSMPLTLLAMKQSPPEGDTHDGVFIPGGTRIGTAIKPILRDPRVFGNDVAVFRPERWLDLEPQQRRNMIDTVELVFGYGRFGCSGKPVAYMELNKVYVELLRNFDFQLVDPRFPMKNYVNVQAHWEEDMWTKVTERV